MQIEASRGRRGAQGGEPVGKMDRLQLKPADWGSVVADSPSAYGLLMEALIPGGYDGERTLAMIEAIRARVARVRAGNTSDLETDLTAQLAWLGGLIAHCTRKGAAEGISPAAADVWLRLALKTQAAYARTAATLAGIALRAVNEGQK